MKRTFRVWIVSVCCLLSSCSIFSPVKVNTGSSYLLNETPNFSRKHTRPVTVLVLLPSASPAYNTTDMAYTTKPFEVSYYSQNHWVETPPQMLQPLLVEALQKSHYFRAVVTPPYLGLYDYVLDTQILMLQQDYTRRPAKVQLVARVQLTKATLNHVAATKEFKIEAPMYQYTPYGGVLAANRATKALLREIVEFCYKKCR